MKSKILIKDREALRKLSRDMTPEERLVAFYNHSKLLAKVKQAGKSSRQAFKKAKIQHAR